MKEDLALFMDKEFLEVLLKVGKEAFPDQSFIVSLFSFKRPPGREGIDLDLSSTKILLEDVRREFQGFPVVLVAFMDRGLGVKKGIPTLVLAASSVDDVFVIVLFAIFLGMYVRKEP